MCEQLLLLIGIAPFPRESNSSPKKRRKGCAPRVPPLCRNDKPFFSSVWARELMQTTEGRPAERDRTSFAEHSAMH